jgi:hypothetical protein
MHERQADGERTATGAILDRDLTVVRHDQAP